MQLYTRTIINTSIHHTYIANQTQNDFQEKNIILSHVKSVNSDYNVHDSKSFLTFLQLVIIRSTGFMTYEKAKNSKVHI